SGEGQRVQTISSGSKGVSAAEAPRGTTSKWSTSLSRPRHTGRTQWLGITHSSSGRPASSSTTQTKSSPVRQLNSSASYQNPGPVSGSLGSARSRASGSESGTNSSSSFGRAGPTDFSRQ